MLTKEDIALLKGMFQSQTESIVSLVRDESRALIAASENRMIARMDRLEQKVNHVAADTAEIIGEIIFPRIEALEYRTDKIEKHPQLV